MNRNNKDEINVDKNKVLNKSAFLDTVKEAEFQRGPDTDYNKEIDSRLTLKDANAYLKIYLEIAPQHSYYKSKAYSGWVIFIDIDKEFYICECGRCDFCNRRNNISE